MKDDRAGHGPDTVMQSIPPEPLTLEGSYILHQMIRVKWPQWKALDASRRGREVASAAQLLAQVEARAGGQSALYSLLGHKGDAMLVHFRRSLEELREAQMQWTRLGFWDFCEYTSSYLSVVEIGLYEGSLRLYSTLAGEGIAAGSEAWKERVKAEITRQRDAMTSRLWPDIPARPYACFYPMDKRRGEARNWYHLPIEQRQAMMRDHGIIGRKYAGLVTQIISGSIGLDNFEWGVDLFADDPLIFKKLVYEMRFDEASAVYGLFGEFYTGIRVRPAELAQLL
ncbi:MAG TPA: hydrogen peroxide-dependent heme synthase [Candidatus Binataceae bacterium]|nr:hydrogen peroxide-dependent heme synthase [Candidatus Binataceae bacterium]